MSPITGSRKAMMMSSISPAKMLPNSLKVKLTILRKLADDLQETDDQHDRSLSEVDVLADVSEYARVCSVPTSESRPSL